MGDSDTGTDERDTDQSRRRCGSRASTTSRASRATPPATSTSTRASSACGSSRRPSTRTTRRSTTSSTPTRRAAPARTSPSSSTRAPAAGGQGTGWCTPSRSASVAPRRSRSGRHASRPRGSRRPSRDDRLRFEDPEGLGLELVVSRVADEPLVARHPEIPAEHALQGFDGVRAFGSRPEASRELLEGVMGFASTGKNAWEVRGAARGGLYALRRAARRRRRSPAPGRCTTSRGRRTTTSTRTGSAASPRPACARLRSSTASGSSPSTSASRAASSSSSRRSAPASASTRTRSTSARR